MQYQTLRSLSDNHLFVVCYDGRFDELPDHVRHQGPLKVSSRRIDWRSRGTAMLW
jgi:hypothetical protein